MEVNSDPPFLTNDVIILAGGAGRRLRKSLGGLPKPMVSILGRPFLEWMILYLRSIGFSSFIISVGYRREVIKNHFQSGARWGIDIQFVEESVPLGTGGALKRASSAAKTQDILILNGDSLCTCDMGDFFRFHRSRETLATLCCVSVHDISRYGTFRRGPGSRIEAFAEKEERSGQGFINAGMYWMRRDFLQGIGNRVPLSLEKDIFPGCTNGSLYAYCTEGDFIDIGTPESLERAAQFLRRNGFLNLASTAR